MNSKDTDRHHPPPEHAIVRGKIFPVLDDGFIRVIDWMGDDSSIVQAARVSYGEGTKKISEDRSLIRYLMRHRHTTPFEMCEIKLHVRVPMDCWRQWIRHRTANVNEYSTRYSIAIDAAQTTQPTEWRKQSSSNKQGSEDFIGLSEGTELSANETILQASARQIYEERLAKGVSREQARKDLPLSTYTEAYWKIDLHNLLHFLSLRMAPEAQYEIRQYANVIGYEIVANWVPIAWQAFLDYRLNAIQLSATELEVLSVFIKEGAEAAKTLLVNLGWVKISTSDKLVLGREAKEFTSKLSRLQLDSALLTVR